MCENQRKSGVCGLLADSAQPAVQELSLTGWGEFARRFAPFCGQTAVCVIVTVNLSLRLWFLCSEKFSHFNVDQKYTHVSINYSDI